MNKEELIITTAKDIYLALIANNDATENTESSFSAIKFDETFTDIVNTVKKNYKTDNNQ